MYWQVKIDAYEAMSKFAFPKRRNVDFKNREEAKKFFDAQCERYRRSKEGYQKVSILLRKMDESKKEKERTRFVIIK